MFTLCHKAGTFTLCSKAGTFTLCSKAGTSTLCSKAGMFTLCHKAGTFTLCSKAGTFTLCSKAGMFTLRSKAGTFILLNNDSVHCIKQYLVQNPSKCFTAVKLGRESRADGFMQGTALQEVSCDHVVKRFDCQPLTPRFLASFSILARVGNIMTYY